MRAPDHIMCTRSNRDGIGGDIQSEPCADFGDAWKAVADMFRVEMLQCQVDARRLGFFHLAYDRFTDHIAGCQFEPWVVVFHEAVPGLIDEVGSFTADRFGDECP